MAYVKRGYPRSRPYMWVTGPDPRTHAQYRAFVQQRNQAVWREEPWTVTFAEYQDLWRDLWEQRGRLSTSYMMTRIDGDLPWSQANSIVITRQQHGQRQADRRSTGRRSPARERELAAVAEQSG